MRIGKDDSQTNQNDPSFSHIMKNPLIALAAPMLGFLAFASLSHAQSSARADAARGTQNTTGIPAQTLTPAPGEDAPALPGDEYYGVQKVIVRQTNWEPWQAGGFAGLSYATNPALLSDNEIDDFYFRGGVYVNYTPHLTGNWFGDFGLSQSFYDYDDLDVLDFAQTYATAGVLYSFPLDAPAAIRNTVASLRYRYEMLTEIDRLSNDFFSEHSVQFALQRTFRVSRGHRAIAGLSGAWSLDSTLDIAARDEYALYFGYRVEWTPEFSTSASVRTAIYDYRDFSRTDWNNILGVSAEYKLTDWASLGAGVSWMFNESDESVFDYNNGDMGVIVSLNITF